MASRLDTSWRRAAMYRRRHGLSATMRRVAIELRTRLPGPSDQSVPRERRADTIRAALDTPAPASVHAVTTVQVAGWACAAAGIESITIHLDERPAGEAMPRLPRQDVAAAWPDIPGAALSGFTRDIDIGDLEAGEHHIAVVVRDRLGSVRVLRSSFRSVEADTVYHRFQLRSLPTPAEEARLIASVGRVTPVVQLTLWVLATPTDRLGSTLRSIAAQSFRSWHCRIVAHDDELEAVRELLDGALSDLGRSGSVTLWGPETPDAATAPDPGYHGVLRAGETLAPGALVRLALAAGQGPDVIYADHDRIDAEGRHVQPVFGPDWSPDRLLSQDYVGGFFLLRASLLPPGSIAAAGAWAGPAGRFDLLLRAVEGAADIVHVPEVLWSEVAPEDGQATRAADVDAADAVRRALVRRGQEADVTVGPAPGVRTIRWPLTRRPSISAIIPTAGRIEYLRPFVESMLARTDHPDLEIVFLDNSRGARPDGIAYLRQRGLRVEERDEPFNWAKLNNDGARLTRGEYLLFLNDDLEITDLGWLDELTRVALRPDVGVTGALLLYPSGRIQHAGVFLVGHGGGAMHWLHDVDPAAGSYLQLHQVMREVSATTGACVLVRRSVFEALGGFDEDLPIVGNDVDLCLRAWDQGYRVIWTPNTSLIHHENVSRSHHPIEQDEVRMWRTWRTRMQRGDPFHNPNLSQHRSDASIDWDRVKDRPDPSPGDPARGVNLVGYLRAEMGVGEGVRGMASALHAVGIPFVALDHRYGNPARQEDRSWSHRVVTQPWFDVNVVAINADRLAEAMTILPPDLRTGRTTVGVWAWELPEFPEAFSHAFALVDEVWAPSVFVRDAIASRSPVPVHHVPHAVRRPRGPFTGRDPFGLPGDAIQFLMMYDRHSVVERKNPDGAIAAFRMAFAPDDRRVSLVIKLNNASTEEVDRLRASVRDQPNIHVLPRVLDRPQLDALLASSDCFVSIHRSEGFGLAIAEAMALGKPVIATRWSGNLDFMRPDNSIGIDHRLVTLERDLGPYRAGGTWAEPDLADAAAAMQRIAADPELRRRLGAQAASTIADRFSPAAVGAIVQARLHAITAMRAAARSRRDPGRGRGA